MTNWIPCKKALYNDFVIACDKYGKIMIGCVYKDDDFSETGYTCESECCVMMYDCVAWMPLPEPYKNE
jgi:hypothetical protein